MTELLSIGDFARATQLSVKALRHYQDEGLLEPTAIDAASGYRRYAIALLPRAQIIRRLRALDMPLADVRNVLESEDVEARNDVIARHLRRLQHELATTQSSIAALQDLLEHPVLDTPIGHQIVPATLAAAIIQDIEMSAAEAWLAGALGELYAVLDQQGVTTGGEAGGIYPNELFTTEHGRATVYLPIETSFTPTGRAELVEVPSAELAVLEHDGPHDGIDRAYGALAGHVARHELAIEGPIREFYVVNRHHTADRSAWRTKIGWPIFATELGHPAP